MFKHCLIVFLVSMVPIIELRGAIPYGVGFGLPLWLTYIIAIVGNMLPVPLDLFLCPEGAGVGPGQARHRQILHLLPGKRAKKGGEKLQAKAGRGLFWALLLFVGIPLPGTGAWTGTLAASLLDMDFRDERAGLHGRRAARRVHHGRAEPAGSLRLRRHRRIKSSVLEQQKASQRLPPAGGK